MVSSERTSIIWVAGLVIMAISITPFVSSVLKSEQRNAHIESLVEQGYSVLEARCALDSRMSRNEAISCMVFSGAEPMEAACAVRGESFDTCTEYRASLSENPMLFLCGADIVNGVVRTADKELCLTAMGVAEAED